MPIPGQKLTIRDPGLGLSETSGNVFLFFGTASAGVDYQILPVNSPGAATDAWGDGELPEAVAHALDVAGGPVYGCKLPNITAGAAGAVTKTGVSTSTGTVTVAGASFGRYEAIVEITKTGALGVAEFRYSLDNGKTWAEARLVPAGGTFLIPRTNLTLTFVAGAGPVLFERGDLHKFTSTAPGYSVTELGLAFDALNTYLSTAPDFTLDTVVLLARHATGSAAVTVFGALAVRLAGLETIYRYVSAIMDAGSGDTRANVKTAFAAVADRRIAVVYGDAVIASSKPFAGFGAPKTSALVAVAARAAASLPSTSLARVADGPLTGVLSISHDEYITEDLDAAKITTLRTWPSAPGFFVTKGRMKSPAGSDFKSWQHRRVMDLACRTVVRAQQPFIESELRAVAGGKIAPTEARRIEEIVKDAMRQALLDPKNAGGRKGHVSDFGYQVDQTNNIVSTEELLVSISVVPLGYVSAITATIGFALTVNQ